MPFFNKKIDCTPSTQESLYKQSSQNISNIKKDGARTRNASEIRPIELKLAPPVA